MRSGNRFKVNVEDLAAADTIRFGTRRRRVLSRVILVLCASCMALVQIPAPAESASPVSPPDFSKIQAVMADFEKYVEENMHVWGTPGMAVAVVHDDRVVYSKGFGVKTIGTREPVTENTIFQIGSTSKAFTSALVAMMVDEKKVAWDDAVVDHLPQFMMYDPWVTRHFSVTDLMAQRSGLPAYSLDTLSFLGFDRTHITRSLRLIRPETSFRSTFAYQNSLFLVAAELVEKHSGKSWEENVHSRIFTPLGMTNSSTDAASFQKAADVVSLHRRMDERPTPLPRDWDLLDWVYTYGPAGGINSNLVDMANWLRMLLAGGMFEGRQIVSSAAMEHLRSPQTVIPSSTEIPRGREYYCQGWIHRENNPYSIVWHNGGTSGCSTMIAFSPQARIGIVILSNLAPAPLPDALAFRFFDMVFGHPARDWSAEYLKAVRKASDEARAKILDAPATPSPSLPAARYAGKYFSRVYGELTVEERDGNLTLFAGPRQLRMPLKHWDRDVFALSLRELTDMPTFVWFQLNREGVPSTVTLDFIEREGGDPFRRKDH